MRSIRTSARYRLVLCCALLSVLLPPAHAQRLRDPLRPRKDKRSPVANSLQDYSNRMHAMAPGRPLSTGSLWVPSGPLANAAADYKARNAGDLIVVRLVDRFTAATSGENRSQRQFSTQAGVTGLFGQVGPRSGLQQLFNANGNTNLDGKGQSTMSSDLQLKFTGQIVEVLPNGVYLVQAARDLAVGNDRQTVILRGLVRPGDLAPDNSVLSTAIGNLEVEIKGKGAVADATRRPNVLIRTILRLLTF
jgi:flagellar L-ring protein precursor FlgH